MDLGVGERWGEEATSSLGDRESPEEVRAEPFLAAWPGFSHFQYWREPLAEELGDLSHLLGDSSIEGAEDKVLEGQLAALGISEGDWADIEEDQPTLEEEAVEEEEGCFDSWSALEGPASGGDSFLSPDGPMAGVTRIPFPVQDKSDLLRQVATRPTPACRAAPRRPSRTSCRSC
jgi:hypothetical protein